MIRQERFKSFILLFLNNYLENMRADGDFPDLHQEWISLMDCLRLAIAAPRSFAKSTYFSIFYPLFLAMEEGPKNILLVSATSTLSEWWLSKIRRELENNMMLIKTYGEQKSGTWRQNEIHLKNGTIIRAIGEGGQTRGWRPDVVLVDDLENEEGVWSENLRLKLSEWFWRSLLNVLNANGQLIIIGTILHPLSLLNTIVKKPPSHWSVRKYAAMKDEESIWPERWPTQKLIERREEIGIPAFEQEYMNNPVPSEWRTFKPENIRYYDELPNNCIFFTTVDPAISITGRDPDFTAIVTCAVDHMRTIYVVDVTRKRMKPSETIQKIIEHYTLYTPEVIGIEVVGFQKVLKYDFDQECEKRGLSPFVKELTTGGMRKSFRIEGLQPFFEKGKILIRDDMVDLEAELLAFPTGKHDDMIDALASQLQLIRTGPGEEVVRAPKGSFDEWFGNFKKQNRRKRISTSKYGNHKLRN